MVNPKQTSDDPGGAVPTSSGRNRSATARMLVIGVMVLAFLMIAIFVPW